MQGRRIAAIATWCPARAEAADIRKTDFRLPDTYSLRTPKQRRHQSHPADRFWRSRQV